MDKLTPRMKSAVYQLAAASCDAWNTQPGAGQPYGCGAIQAALWHIAPHLRNDSDLHDAVTAKMCDAFTSTFRNPSRRWAQERERYGEFGNCLDPEAQEHRITALCLMAEIAKDYA